jgi:hypothetical protein
MPGLFAYPAREGSHTHIHSERELSWGIEHEPRPQPATLSEAPKRTRSRVAGAHFLDAAARCGSARETEAKPATIMTDLRVSSRLTYGLAAV